MQNLMPISNPLKKLKKIPYEKSNPDPNPRADDESRLAETAQAGCGRVPVSMCVTVINVTAITFN